MVGKRSVYLKHHLPLIALIITSILCIAISIFSLQSGVFIIFQNVFYIPIIISCFYYKKRGFIFSVILACIYFLLILAFTKESLIILQALIRVFIFILVAGVITHLSLLHKEVKELRIATVYNRSLIEASLDPLLVVGTDGKIMDVNEAMEEATGYHRTALIGNEFSSYFTEPEKVRTIYKNVFQAHSFRNQPLEILHRDGHVTLVLYNATLYQDESGQVVGVFAAARDITERKRVEEKLKQSEERYRSIFENVQEGIFRSTPDGRITMANQAFAKMLGYDSPEELMTCITDLNRQVYVDVEDRRKLENILEEHGFIKGYEVRHYKKDESIIWVALTMQAVYDRNGEIAYYDGINEDITDRKQRDERTRKALGSTVQAITVTVEMRDPYTAGHQYRVANLAHAIAREMSLSIDQIDGIRMAAAIHDLGKISVPAEILSKPTKLTNIELSLIKTHPQSGYDILKDIDFPWPIARIILEHHERMNGSGYPNGLTGDNILMESRILSVADVVESMASHRPYRPALGIEAALEEIKNHKGTLYDAVAVEACSRLLREKEFHLEGA